MKLSNERTFLVRLGAWTDSDSGPVGRIEHIDSGRRTRFSSLDEIRDFMWTVLLRESLVEVEERSYDAYTN